MTVGFVTSSRGMNALCGVDVLFANSDFIVLSNSEMRKPAVAAQGGFEMKKARAMASL